jgi:hypothetical protein
MSSIFWYYLFIYLLGTVWCTVYLFACVAYFWSLPLSAEDFENLQELDIQDFEQQLAGEQGKWPLTMVILCAFFL